MCRPVSLLGQLVMESCYHMESEIPTPETSKDYLPKFIF